MVMIHIPMCFVLFDGWRGEVKNGKIKRRVGVGVGAIFRVGE